LEEQAYKERFKVDLDELHEFNSKFTPELDKMITTAINSCKEKGKKIEKAREKYKKTIPKVLRQMDLE
jgi:hypothetical protein